MSILPSVIAIGGATYVLVQSTPQAPPMVIRPVGGGVQAGSQAGFFPLPGQLPDQQSKVDLLLRAAQARYDSLSDTARAAAAHAMNGNLGTQLNGTESWEALIGAASGAGASAACTAIPGIGAFTAPLCSIAGTYLGVQLEQWLGGDLGNLVGWVQSNISSAITDVVGDAADAVVGWFRGLF